MKRLAMSAGWAFNGCVFLFLSTQAANSGVAMISLVAAFASFCRSAHWWRIA